MFTLQEYAQVVEEMRQAQKTFFAAHTQSALRESKKLEKRVDAMTLQIVNQLPQQRSLFEAPGNDSRT